MCAFIDDYRDDHGVEQTCAALQGKGARIAPSTYYAHRSRPPAPRAVRDAELTEKITQVRKDNYGVYGARKVHAELRRQNIEVARCTVERLMRGAGLRGISRVRSPRTTKPAPVSSYPQDLVERQFVAEVPNQLWVTDITHIRTFAGWVYAAFVTDVFSRRTPPHGRLKVSTSLRTHLALDALEMGLWIRERNGADTSRLIHHSDRDGQYVSVRYSERLALADAVASVGSRGDSYDNAMAEAFHSLFKAERVRNHGGPGAASTTSAPGRPGSKPNSPISAALWRSRCGIASVCSISSSLGTTSPRTRSRTVWTTSSNTYGSIDSPHPGARKSNHVGAPQSRNI